MVRFFDLSWEYWHPKIIFELARGIRVPLRLEKATSDEDFSHYARVLVVMDVSSVLLTSVLLERDEFHSSFIVVEYKNLPAFCSTCSSIGHLFSSYRWNKSSKEEVPLSNDFLATHHDLDGQDSVVVHTSGHTSRPSSRLGHTARRFLVFVWSSSVHCHDQQLTVSLSIGSRVYWYAFVCVSTSVVVRRSGYSIFHKIWSSLVVGRPHQVVINKLRSLKNALKTWNWEVFRDLNSAITGKSAELHSIQLDLSNRVFSTDLFMAKVSVLSELDVLLHRHEYFFRDWSRVRWLYDGDHKISFFHASIRSRHYRNTISAISINEVLSEDRPAIMDYIIGYYSDLFSLDVSRVGRDLSIVNDVIPSLVTAVENAFLTSIPFADVIHDAVFVMDDASSPRPDGFSGRFYQRCWDVVGSDVVLTVHDFFITGVIFLDLNSIFIILLSKQRDLISIDQFQPIVLSNFLFKISSKILADCLISSGCGQDYFFSVVQIHLRLAYRGLYCFGF
ncbi:hypothetical protein Dsin_012586 [Dipteronia sinensis]|uniref:Reverse transcriptase n=1 Tax=Dipteronia sinensis TaxID=43782 RepID=A0AAE0E864_9ROSI|nr:hypothetical protein Dsin_012586 [Dipteronia sinensis]